MEFKKEDDEVKDEPDLIDGIISKDDLSARKLLPKYVEDLNKEINKAIDEGKSRIKLWYFPKRKNTIDINQDSLIMIGDNVNGYDAKSLTSQDSKRVINTLENNGFIVEREFPTAAEQFAAEHGYYNLYLN